jgi:hypothetical protein
MARRVRCDCGEVFPVDRDQLGRRVRCPACREVFVANLDEEVPERERELDELEEVDDRPRSRKRSDARRPRRSESSRAAKPRTEGPLGKLAVHLREPLWSACLLVGTALMLASVVVGLWASFGTSVKPKEKSLKQLVAEGADNKPYIDLTDFFPSTLVYYHYVNDTTFQVGNKVEQKWTDIYVPLFARTKKPRRDGQLEEEPEPDAIPVLLHSTSIQDAKEVERLATRSQIRGVAHYPNKPLDSKMTSTWQARYPKTDFSRVILLESDRRPVPTGGMVWLIIGGFGFLGCAFFLYVRFGC